MPLLTIAIVVLAAWCVGAAAGSASTALTGAAVGAAAALVLFAIVGAVSAWRHPTERDQNLRPY
jgi:multisubunit Na+/H+ antiporter MnhE subunit